MKVSYQWLNQWARTDLDAATAGERLTLAGLELDGLEAAAPPLDGVVTGTILSAERHPDADRLQVCQVDAGGPEPLQIVCGAPNARAGLHVAVATIGTRLPGDFKIKKSKIRGVESFGMLCSGAELGMEGTDGILELPESLDNGLPLSRALGLDDSILDIALTPNRGDCFSVRGIARELACVAGTRFAPPFENPQVEVSLDASRQVAIENAEDCSSYAGRIVTGLDRSIDTPSWLAERLRRSGLRSINPLVDVTNYVMLELGQPMHAFDLSRLQGDITVRRARSGETLTLLNEESLDLGPDELVIADASGPIALAGAMGGLASAVDDETRDVFLESACFSPSAVAGTGRKFKLSSDSLQRFERGVDPDLQLAALERATALLIDIAGGQAGPVVHTRARPWQPRPTELLLARVEQLLGCPLEPCDVIDILRRLECQVEPRDGTLHILPPSHRYDLQAPIDYVEEIARIHGYDRLPGRERRVSVPLRVPQSDRGQTRLRAELVARGYFEAISFSFADARMDEALCPADTPAPVRLDNPMAAWMAHMRRSLWASLLPVWKHNVQRQQDRVRLFEIGRKYALGEQGPMETEVLAGVVSGLAQPEQWSQARRTVDFYDLKADLLALLGNQAEAIHFSAEQVHPALHPGRSARLLRDGQVVGHLGQLHPRLQRSLDLPQAPLLFELDMRLWSQATTAVSVINPGSAPSTRRDLALVVDQSLAAGELMQYVKSNAGTILREVRIFDVFTGDALPKGFKSVALGLIFQDFSRTLTDQEVDASIQTLTAGLEREFGAQIRD